MLRLAERRTQETYYDALYFEETAGFEAILAHDKAGVIWSHPDKISS